MRSPPVPTIFDSKNTKNLVITNNPSIKNSKNELAKKLKTSTLHKKPSSTRNKTITNLLPKMICYILCPCKILQVLYCSDLFTHN